MPDSLPPLIETRPDFTPPEVPPYVKLQYTLFRTTRRTRMWIPVKCDV
jgi:hypothetical protein